MRWAPHSTCPICAGLCRDDPLRAEDDQLLVLDLVHTLAGHVRISGLLRTSRFCRRRYAKERVRALGVTAQG